MMSIRWKYIKASVKGYKIIFFLSFRSWPTQLGFDGVLTLGRKASDFRQKKALLSQRSRSELPFMDKLDCDTLLQDFW
jgi:hypothetical protein